MKQKNKSRPDPSGPTAGRTDAVHQSKGIFPPGVPHPPDADVLPPGKLGGGPYEESGRGGVVRASASLDRPNPAAESASGEEAPGEAKSDADNPEDQEPKGVLTP
jgi:hypothetical protein